MESTASKHVNRRGWDYRNLWYLIGTIQTIREVVARLSGINLGSQLAEGEQRGWHLVGNVAV